MRKSHQAKLFRCLFLWWRNSFAADSDQIVIKTLKDYLLLIWPFSETMISKALIKKEENLRLFKITWRISSLCMYVNETFSTILGKNPYSAPKS